jgi:hypothetical protein
MPGKSCHWELLNIDFGRYSFLDLLKSLFLKAIFLQYDLNTPVNSLSQMQHSHFGL